MQKYLEILKRCALLQNLNDSEILSILPCLKAKSVSFPKGAVLFSEGDTAEYTGIILNGTIEIQKTDLNGNSNIISKLSIGDLVAAVAVYSSSKLMPFDAVCASDCEILYLDASNLIRTCCKTCIFHTKIIENMMSAIADKNIQLSNKIDILTKRTIREKITAYLFSQSKKIKNKKFKADLSRRQMAEYFSVDRSALSKELCKMRDEGLLEFDKNIFILK